MSVVYIHGAGSAGQAAWPIQAAEGDKDWVFLARANGGDDPSVSTRDFSRLFAAGMGFEPPVLSEDELEAKVSRLRALRPPWGIGLRDEERLPVPTFVITGGGSSLYEETAQALVALGARHQVLEGAGHRVQDAPGTTDVLRCVWAQS